jgi:membrane protein
VPLIFLALAGLALIGQLDASSALVTYLDDIFPGQSVDDIVGIVQAVQRNARALTIVGAAGLLWSSLSLFSSLESAFNIIYGRPNRPFLRGKAVAVGYMGAALLVLLAGLIAGTFGYSLLSRYAPDFFGNLWVALVLTLTSSGIAIFLFLLSAYYRLTNIRLTVREVLPGAIVGAIVLELSLQGLPLFVWIASDLVALQALGTTFLLLFWLYVMANVIVFGAAFNYEVARDRPARPEPEVEEEADTAELGTWAPPAARAAARDSLRGPASCTAWLGRSRPGRRGARADVEVEVEHREGDGDVGDGGEVDAGGDEIDVRERGGREEQQDDADDRA